MGVVQRLTMPLRAALQPSVKTVNDRKPKRELPEVSGYDTVLEQAQRKKISVGLSGSGVDPRSTTVTGTITHKKLQKLKQTQFNLCIATMQAFFDVRASIPGRRNASG